MGIENIDILKANEPEELKTTRRKMSRHIARDEGRYSFIFGWDQPLQSFFLVKYDQTAVDENNEHPITVSLGNTKETTMYEVEDLVHIASLHGLSIPYETQVKLYGEKDDGV
jgi:hypothetical protein